MPAVNFFANEVAQQRVSIAKRDSPVQVDHGHAADLATGCLETDRKPFLCFCEGTS